MLFVIGETQVIVNCGDVLVMVAQNRLGYCQALIVAFDGLLNFADAV